MPDRDINQAASGNNNQQAVGNINNNQLTINTNYLQTKCPSHISKIILKLNAHLNTADVPTEAKPSYTIAHKIEHNELVKYKSIVSDYSVYGSIVDTSFESLDNEAPFSKRKIYDYINLQYKIAKATLARQQGVDLDMNFVKKNSDNIMDIVLKDLERVYCITNTPEITYEEAIVSLTIIVCKAFIDCKILENPN